MNYKLVPYDEYSLLKTNHEILKKDHASLKEAIQQTQQAAWNIQKAYLPDLKKINTNTCIEAYYIYKPRQGVGGDILEIQPLKINILLRLISLLFNIKFLKKAPLGIFIGDVVGKGFPAAYISAICQMTIDSAFRNTPYKPQKFLQRLNKYFWRDIRIDTFVTGGYGYFKRLANGKTRFTWAKGGHCFPIIYKKEKNLCFELPSRGKVLRVLEEKKYHPKKTYVDLDKGDRVFLYTDGLSEASDKNGSELHEDNRWYNIFGKHANMPIKKTIEQVELEIINKLKKTPNDDIVIVGCEIK